MLFRAFKTLFTSLILLGCNSSTDSGNNTNEPKRPFPTTRQQVLELAVTKYKHQAEKLDPENGFPRSAESSHWQLTNWQSWTDGFFPGILWQLSTIDDRLESQAIRWTLPLESYANLNSHDLGFIINNSFGIAYRITGDPQFLPTIELAAANLSARYNTNVKAIRSWDFGNFEFPVIIDNMMNLALLFDTTKYGLTEPYYSTAINHAFTTQQHHLRINGGNFHLVDFSIKTGEVIKKQTVQGLNNESNWSRGQAWGIYGFTYAYTESGEQLFLQTAQKMADYFINHLPEDKVPLWDFDAKSLTAPKDSSAAAIAASGLWQLSVALSDNEQANKYKQASLKITDSLISSHYLNNAPNFPALLLHATGNKPAEKEVDTSLIYADYFFIEALLMQEGYTLKPL